MKVKIKTVYAGPRGSFQPGQVADLSQAEAYALCEGGFAEQIAEAPPPDLFEEAKAGAPVETAAAAPAETATSAAQSKKLRKRP